MIYFHDNASQAAMQKAIDARTMSMKAFEERGNSEKVLQLAYIISDMVIDKAIVLDNKAHKRT